MTKWGIPLGGQGRESCLPERNHIYIYVIIYIYIYIYIYIHIPLYFMCFCSFKPRALRIPRKLQVGRSVLSTY